VCCIGGPGSTKESRPVLSARLEKLVARKLRFDAWVYSDQIAPSIDELCDAFRPFIRHALEVFGTGRAFFASNFPMDKPSAPLGRVFGAYAKLAKECGPGVPRLLLRENALRFYACGEQPPQ